MLAMPVVGQVPVTRRCSFDAGRPLRKLALSLGTSLVLLTESGGDPVFAFSDRGIPLVLVSVVTVVAELLLPRRKVPPVAASATPTPETSRPPTPTSAAGAVIRTTGRERSCRRLRDADFERLCAIEFLPSLPPRRSVRWAE